jgi:crossover junction endodeoxyribonuclease RuvC
MSLILAIDPGISGGLVVMDQLGRYVDHLLTPTIKTGSRSKLNGAAIAAWINEHVDHIDHAFIELVGAMPGQGVTAMFTFGHAAGFIEGLVSGAQIPLTLVPPTTWKKYSGFVGKEKDAPRSRAVQLYPALRVLDQKGKGQAIADALFIGLYGLSTLPKGNQYANPTEAA